ncbi:adenosine deaminase [Rhizodiscina lignyota]|uniref:Adenine deaminase n=1 Tax=Rhizodiscina lignyota TaxID=1504668 RepID=A0A9P4I4C1_9PEZI|nr:adenosine deaminase [Rhizodiscina lignyota]
MCKSSIHSFLQALPKVEHHMHIEGALSPSLIFKLAAKNGIELPKDDSAFSSVESLVERYKHFTSLDDFLHYYYIGMSVLLSAGDFEALAWDYFQHAAADGVVHAELFYDPQAHTSRGVSYSTIVSGISAARKRAESEFGITTELICCFLRHLPVSDSLMAFDSSEIQASFKDGSVIGIGLDSTELDKPPHLWKELYAKAATQELNLTAHAGEEGPAEYITDALASLHISRIDHGVHLIDDPELMASVAKEGIMLTVCPISNVVLKCFPSIKDVPIRKFLDAGVRFSINSDDPAYFGGYILDNYCAVDDAFQLSAEEWKSVCRAAIEGSWCSEERKAELLERLHSVMEHWRSKVA